MSNSTLVWSSDNNSTCPKCKKTLRKCKCSTSSSSASNSSNSNTPKDGIARVTRITKGKKGNGVSAVTGIALSDFDLKDLAKKIKVKCGVGGTVKNGVIEIQSDNRALIVQILEKEGFKAKIAGG